MSGLNSLEIVNFQSHEKTILNLHPGINCIVGVSQRGKTAIFRAVKLLRKNRPLKFKFHSDFAKSGVTRVTAITPEGQKATINKTRKRTKYTLNDRGTISHWRKLNKDVPDRIKDAINLTDMNMQGQFDAPFLISTSPGEIARVIHEKTNIDKADEWIKTLNKNINKLKQLHQDGILEVEETIEQLKNFTGLNKINRRLNKLEKIEITIDALEEDYIKIDGLLANIIDVEEKIKEQKYYLEAKKQVDEIDGIDDKLKALNKEQELIERALELEVVLSEYQDDKDKYNKQYLRILKRIKLCPICFGPLESADIKRISNEIYSSI